MARKSTIRKNWPRYVLQWGVLAGLVFFLSGLAGLLFKGTEPADPEAFCPMGGLEALATYGVRGSLPCSMSSLQIMMGLALAAAVILFSKLFCGYLCPVGTVEDLLRKLRKLIGIKPLRIPSKSVADKLLRLVKYVLVFWIFYSTATASELFCKNLDPYYAVATGFKGEITLWMSLVTVGLVVIGGFLVDMFWCKYICPLGAISNSLKFWSWMLGISLLWFVLGKLGMAIAWPWLLGALCLAGYLLEIINGKPAMQLLYVFKDDSKCSGCGLCNKACPYGIDVAGGRGRLMNVDCTLCGECTAACSTEAIKVGVGRVRKGGFWQLVPAICAVLLVCAGFWVGNKVELPTIDETWNLENVDKGALKTMEIMPLRSVKCYGSSMAFKGKVSQIPGIYGVRTFVGKHRVVLTYDPSVITPEQIQEAIFVPSKFRVENPDPSVTERVKVLTIRTEGMPDKMDLNNFGMQLRLSGKKIYGVETEFACPLIVRVFLDPEEQADAAWFKEIVEKKTLEMPTAKGEVKVTPLDFKFIKLEPSEDFIPVADYIRRMFTPFRAEFNGKYEDGVKKRTEVYEGKPQFVFEIENQNYEKPIVQRYLPFLSNHISREEGVIGMYCVIDDNLVPAIQVRYAAPCTEDKIWELMTMDTWTITYSVDDVRQEPAKLGFKERGVSRPWTPAE
ncbi:MAG: 4Fe-4S binding protein [Bacteroidales bacterium]|nr:4Fe-4S binding protein [Bacteroidales bacterium]